MVQWTTQSSFLPFIFAEARWGHSFLQYMIVFIFQEQLVASKGPAEDTALHLAARKGDNDLVKFFIEAGAKVDAQNVSTESKTKVPLWGEESIPGTESGIE
jgi:hypothetical protein